MDRGCACACTRGTWKCEMTGGYASSQTIHTGRMCLLSNHLYNVHPENLFKKKNLFPIPVYTHTRASTRVPLEVYAYVYIYIYITMITRRTCLPFLVTVRKTFQRFSVDGNPFCKIRFCSLRRLLSLIKDISGSTRLLLDLLRRKECVVVIDVSINREITHNNNNKGGERPSESPRNARPDVQS